jgi:hypothetical protein
MRKAIWQSRGDLGLRTVEVPLDKEDAKKIWDKLQEALPTFALFRSDRPSLDEDAEVQDPMKVAVSQAIRSVASELETIKARVQEEATAVAMATVEKLREMDPNLAGQLSPNFRAEPKWESLFKLTLTGDNEIPINKRGSGVRRLVLLNFFRAAAERRQQETGSPGIIYAVEEPETSQHPRNQRMLLEALSELSRRGGCQVIVTTHVPGLAGLLPLDAIRHITGDPKGTVRVDQGGDDVYEEIARELGVVPDNRVRVLVCVEGPNDVSFLRHVSRMLRAQDPSLPDLKSDASIICLPLGGATLVQWVHEHYLKGLGRPEVHIYDRGDESPPRYGDEVELVNKRTDGSWAVLTRKRELENYLHADAIAQALEVSVNVSDDMDVPLEAARALHQAAPNSHPWDTVDDETRGKKESSVKRRLNDEAASKMTSKLLAERDPTGELVGWLRRIAAML